MTERPRFFDDLAGVAGGAMSALMGLGEEMEALIRSRMEEAMRRLELVRKPELEAVQELAARARAGQEAAEAEIASLKARVVALEARLAATAASSEAGAERSSGPAVPPELPDEGA
jgi:BMFP domain-containing protein YqiC